MSYQLLNDPFQNKGTAFTTAERRSLGLEAYCRLTFKRLINRLSKLTLSFKRKQRP